MIKGSYEIDVLPFNGSLSFRVVDHPEVGFLLNVPPDTKDDAVFSWLVNNLTKLTKQAIDQILAEEVDEEQDEE